MLVTLKLKSGWILQCLHFVFACGV
jgi:hypothetical protein